MFAHVNYLFGIDHLNPIRRIGTMFMEERLNNRLPAYQHDDYILG